VFHDEQKGALRGKNTIYRIEVDGVSIVHLGDLGHMLTSEELEALDGVNILMLPVGGLHTIDAAKASHLINEIEPSIVIPMHYGRPELNQKIFGTLAPLSVFLKEIGKEGVAPVPKLVISKDKLPTEMQVVVFE
jgi:L-ascorbate metabolism protein UlaG (beta-lactamase superfamily)